MTPLERIEPEVADEVADELDVQMREMTPLEPEVADEFANQCLADSFFARHMDGAAPFDSFDSLGEHAGSSAGSSPDSSPRNATDASSRYMPADDSLSVCSTEAAGESDGIEAWDCTSPHCWFSLLGTDNVEETAGRPLFGAENPPEFSGAEPASAGAPAPISQPTTPNSMLSVAQVTSFPAAATPNPQKGRRGAIIERHTKTRGNTRTRGTNFDARKKQRVQTALLKLLFTKLREGHDFCALTLKALEWELADIARTLAEDDVKEINLNAANHPHAFCNMVTVLFNNEFRKGAIKERHGARGEGSSAASSRGFARVLSKFARSDDLADDMAQLWSSCVAEDLGKDKLEAVRLMRMQSMGPETVSTLPLAGPEMARLHGPK